MMEMLAWQISIHLFFLTVYCNWHEIHTALTVGCKKSGFEVAHTGVRVRRQEYFDSHSTEELAQVIEELHLSSKEQAGLQGSQSKKILGFFCEVVSARLVQVHVCFGWPDLCHMLLPLVFGDSVCSRLSLKPQLVSMQQLEHFSRLWMIWYV